MLVICTHFFLSGLLYLGVQVMQIIRGKIWYLLLLLCLISAWQDADRPSKSAGDLLLAQQRHNACAFFFYA